MADNWSLDGTYMETCNCAAACPCVFLSDPTEGECTVLVGWHIDRGHFADVPLDGLNVAMAAYAPGNMLTNKWQAGVYFDEKASPQQQDALHKIFGGQVGGHPQVLMGLVGQVLGAKTARIHFEARGKGCSMRVEGAAEADIEALQGQGGAQVTIQNHPLAVAPGFPAVSSKSRTLRLDDFGFHWELSDRTGFFSPFHYAGGH
jgi:hypothetical protein